MSDDILENQRSIPVSPSILYQQRESLIGIRLKNRKNSVTLSSIKSEYKKEGGLTCHTPGKRGNKSLRCRHSPKILNQDQTFLII